MLLTQMVVGLKSWLLLRRAVRMVHRQRHLRRVRPIQCLLQAQGVRSSARFQVWRPVLRRRRALHPVLSPMPVLSDRDLLLLVRMHRARERLIVLLVLLVVLLNRRLAVDLVFGVAASRGGRGSLGLRSCEIDVLILDHLQELDGLGLSHVLHVEVQLVHELRCLLLV